MYGSLLVPVVLETLETLPVDVRRNLARVKENNGWQLFGLTRAIKKETNIFEIACGDTYTPLDVNDNTATEFCHISTKDKKVIHVLA